jgi:hypothetical protein
MDHRDRWQAHLDALAQQTEHVAQQTPALAAQTYTLERRLLERLTRGLYGMLAVGLVVGWLTPAGRAGHQLRGHPRPRGEIPPGGRLGLWYGQPGLDGAGWGAAGPGRPYHQHLQHSR